MCVISLLSRLGKDAKPVEPAISRALKDDDEGVREIAVGSYNNGLLDVIGPREKAARLPAFLRAVQDKNWGIRNNAVLALGSYTNDAPTVIPALVVALHDTEMRVQLVAAEALVHMNIQAAIKANVIPILIQILKFPDDQIAFQAAAVLGEMGKDASPAVPALTESLKSPFALVAQTAGIALKKIDPEAGAVAKEK
jgi:HEAT repeat protein